MIDAGSLLGLRGLPKAELHVHLDGSMRPPTAVELARDIGVDLTLADAEERLIAPAACRDQLELLRFFELPIALLQTREALRRVARELVEAMADDGVTYAEVRWAPRLHLERGLSVEEVIAAVAEGIAGARPAGAGTLPLCVLIVTAMRTHAPRDNAALADVAARFGPPVVAFDLAGPEAAYPAAAHAEAFRVAGRRLALSAHAGEVRGSERVSEALDLGVRRVAHGVTVARDTALLDRVKQLDVTLDLCPTSNVQAGVVPSLSEHPFAALHRSGVSITLSTDDRTVSNTTLSAELERCAAATGLTRSELAEIAVNAFRRAFGPRTDLDRLTASAEAAWERWAAGAERGPPTDPATAR